MGIYISASVSAAATVVEHPLPATDTTFAVSPDEPLFGENIPPEKPEKDEEMSYRETVRSIRAFLGWNFISDFELSYSDPDKSNNQ